ncbi:MAG: glycosyltransferase family 4 protein [Kosmotoga sp.]|nr:MAG: glycosyltransferase family 4 protein [Kosmotoga sp.]
MKLLLIGPLPPPIHGISKSNELLYKSLKLKHEIDFLDTSTNRAFEDLERQGKLNHRRIFTSFYQVIKGWGKIFFNKYDVVYITPGQSIYGYLKYTPFMWVAKIRKIPYFIHIHGGFFRTMYNSLSRSSWKRKVVDKSLKRLSGAMVLGPSLKYMFEGLIPDENIFVCENGVEDEIFATKKEIEDKAERYKNDEVIRVVYLSNLMESKGILDLLEAVNILKNEEIKVHLDIAGAIEPAIESEVKKYILELGDIVTYHGVVKGDRKKQLLLENHFFCLPSKHLYGEGQPISILEAMANGCIIITTDHGGIKDIVNEKYGYFVEKQNPKSIVQALSNEGETEMIYSSWIEAKSNYHEVKFVNKLEVILLNSKINRN